MIIHKTEDRFTKCCEQDNSSVVPIQGMFELGQTILAQGAPFSWKDIPSTLQGPPVQHRVGFGDERIPAGDAGEPDVNL